MKIFAKIRFYYVVFVIAFIAGVIMVPLMILFEKDTSKILHKYNALIMKLIGGKVEKRGERDNSADMFIINHQGIIDIIAFEGNEYTDIQWIAKRQLFDTPWYGNLLKLPKMINVDRENKSGLIKLIKDTKEAKEAEHHRTIGIFPEGTRNDKQELRTFKAGAKIVAEKLKLKVQPIVITNSKKLLDQHRYTSYSATVHIEYLDTFIPDRKDKEWYKNLQKRMQEIIDREKEIHGRER
jgi:1-acyl-sn-glycerol-3-phosphate acyltransferase